MKKSIFLSLFSILAAACLLYVLTSGMAGMAAINAAAVQQHTMRALLPGSETFTEEPCGESNADILSVHKGETGFVVETVAQGYADEIVMLISVSNDGTVTGLVVKDMHETFGLGGNALTDWEFLAQFLNTSGGTAIGTPGADAFSGATGTDANETEIYVDGMTGATVTSKAVARCVNAAVSYVTGADTVSSATSWGG